MNQFIVMQGPIVQEGSITSFKQNLNRILGIGREYAVSIIVSTWEMDSDIEQSLRNEYPAVKFLFNSDPGALVHEVKSTRITCNVNRLIVSMQTALEEIPGGAVVLKIRTDSFIYNFDSFEKFQEFQNKRLLRNHQYSLFENFILCANLFIRNPKSHIPMLYHPGDICLIGYCSDLKKMFNIDLATEKIFKSSGSIRVRTEYALVPEQYIFLSALRKNISTKNVPISFEKNFDYVKNESDISNQYLINNFIFFECRQLGFNWPKYKAQYLSKGWSSIYDYNDWKYLQNRYNATTFKTSRGRITLKKIMVLFAKLYYPIRNILLQNKHIYKIAYKLFANR